MNSSAGKLQLYSITLRNVGSVTNITHFQLRKMKYPHVSLAQSLLNKRAKTHKSVKSEARCRLGSWWTLMPAQRHALLSVVKSRTAVIEFRSSDRVVFCTWTVWTVITKTVEVVVIMLVKIQYINIYSPIKLPCYTLFYVVLKLSETVFIPSVILADWRTFF